MIFRNHTEFSMFKKYMFFALVNGSVLYLVCEKLRVLAFGYAYVYATF